MIGVTLVGAYIDERVGAFGREVRTNTSIGAIGKKVLADTNIAAIGIEVRANTRIGAINSNNNRKLGADVGREVGARSDNDVSVHSDKGNGVEGGINMAHLTGKGDCDDVERGDGAQRNQRVGVNNGI